MRKSPESSVMASGLILLRLLHGIFVKIEIGWLDQREFQDLSSQEYDMRFYD
jgi:hypothetical protein